MKERIAIDILRGTAIIALIALGIHWGIAGIVPIAIGILWATESRW